MSRHRNNNMDGVDNEYERVSNTFMDKMKTYIYTQFSIVFFKYLFYYRTYLRHQTYFTSYKFGKILEGSRDPVAKYENHIKLTWNHIASLYADIPVASSIRQSIVLFPTCFRLHPDV